MDTTVSRMTLARDLGLVSYLAWTELRRRYAGSVGGMLWGFLSPVLTLLALWLVFGLGLKVDLGGGNFLPMLVAALAVWLAFADAVNTATRSITASPHLVKRLRFPIATLPLAAVGSALIVHAVVLAVALALLIVTGHAPGLRLLALPYYVAAFVALVAPLAVLLAIANVVARDTAEITSAAVSLLFWATPIVWPASLVPERWQWLLKLNPAGYLVEGYRRTLAGAGESWIDVPGAVVFWLGTALLAFVASYVYGRLRLFLSDFL